jgi:hypothetical protein
MARHSTLQVQDLEFSATELMRKRLSIVFVVVALLFSAWGNVIAAAFCPRFALNRDCCLKHAARQANQVKHESSCHHEMAGMEMDDMQMEIEVDSPRDASAKNSQVELTSESSNAEAALDLQIEPCAHCFSHSQPTSGTVSVVAIDPSKRLVETNSLPANFAIGLTAAFADSIVPSEHGPPGSSSPRHVIINVFRI